MTSHGMVLCAKSADKKVRWSTHGIGVVDQSLDDEYSPADCSL